jgi:glycosyltransferase involved in cell wall biosynthesis
MMVGCQNQPVVNRPIIMGIFSVIASVFNAETTLDRAVESVVKQTFSDWELLLVDDGSTDQSHARMQAWAKRDSRIRILRTPQQTGSPATRNLGIRHAQGEWLTYLDLNDEWYPGCLDAVVRMHDKGNVFVFRLDQGAGDASTDTVEQDWAAVEFRQLFFAKAATTPIGVVHRRALVEKVGGFNELLWGKEDWDLWRRFARAGAEFVFLAMAGGRRHFRVGSLGHGPRPTDRQRAAIATNWQAGRPIFANGQRKARGSKVHKIAFVSPHCVIDYFNGASIATVQALQFLHELGFECQAFCGSRLDTPGESLVEEQLARQHTPYEIRKAKIGDYDARMLFTFQDKVPVTLFQSASTRGAWLDMAETTAFFQAYGKFLDANRPDVVMTYGGDPIQIAMIDLAKKRDIPVVFALHNCFYTHAGPFAAIDYATAPSDFARRFYWETLGLACQTLPNVVDWERVAVADRQPRYATFVNPQSAKGVYVFAAIAEELARRRPDIPLLVVESRGQAGLLARSGLDLSGMPNVRWMETTPDPREFYRLTRVVLMPSLCEEVFGLVAVEAMLNGIPVLASTRGALPEVVGAGGFLFDIPVAYTPATTTIPSPGEVEPWVETIVQLWDDAARYERVSGLARVQAEQWHPRQLVPIYREFFGSISPQPAPPLVPR